MPAFDPVRDAVLNSPVSQFMHSPTISRSPPLASPSLGRRATHLSVLLNSQEPSLRTPPSRSSTLSHLLHNDHDNILNEKLDASQPLTRFTVDTQSTPRSSKSMFTSSPSPTRESRSRPSSSSSSVSMSSPSQSIARPRSNMPPPPPPPPPPPHQPQSTVPYNPKVRMTPPTSVLKPMSPTEMEMYKDYRFRGRGAIQIASGVKRKRSEEPPESAVDQPPTKKLAGDVGVVVDHCESSYYTRSTALTYPR
jgi:mRNA (guanine-N7-)-methyltransferase